MKKICHLTSLHDRNDSRIFYKELVSLSRHFDTSLIVADNLGNEEKNSVKIYDTGREDHHNRIRRFYEVPRQIINKACELECDLYHFHDPDLLPVGLKLLKKGRLIIYDVHEDLPRDILYKSYIPGALRKPLSSFVELYENRLSSRFSYIITSTPYIRDRFLKINSNTADIKNYPLLDELFDEQTGNNRSNDICYLGGIARNRGIFEMIKALENLNIKLHLAGNFETPLLKQQLQNEKAWPNVVEYGYVGRPQIRDILGRCSIGMVILHPISTFIESLPIKLFEYMSAGLPVICSDFPLWKSIVEDNNCGICINPKSVNEITAALEFLLNNQAKAVEMGHNGRAAVEKFFNWNAEESRLIDIYKKLLN